MYILYPYKLCVRSTAAYQNKLWFVTAYKVGRKGSLDGWGLGKVGIWMPATIHIPEPQKCGTLRVALFLIFLALRLITRKEKEGALVDMRSP